MAPKCRTQFYLDQRQKKILEEKSAETGKSIGYLIREAIDDYFKLSRPNEGVIAVEDPIWGIVGLGESQVGESKGSIEHDDAIYGTESDEWLQGKGK